MKTKKTPVIVTIIVIAVIVIGGILYYGMRGSSVTTPATSSSAAMVGWKTYQSSLYGISLKYPADWSLALLSSTSTSNSAAVLDKNGYKLTIEMCNVKDCGGAVNQVVDPNERLLPSESVPLNVGGFKAWRTVDPLPNGEDDPTLLFSFTFLRNATPSANQPSFNDTSKFTPVSSWINDNGMVYTINYQLPSTTTASDYDHSIINQMDGIAQSIIFGH